jgi:hypothetical protein
MTMSEVLQLSHLDRGGYEGPHELHVTVDAKDTDPEQFREVCKDLDIKAHIISNELPNSEPILDYLTGSEYRGSSGQAYIELGRIASGLKESGFNVVREKIETEPWHPNSPKTNLDRLAEGTYFECHFTLPDLPTVHRITHLKWGDVPFLISTTEKKRQSGLLFATMRHYISTAGEFVKNTAGIYAALSEQIDNIPEPTVEYSLYDSNPDHDTVWVNSYRKL